jgi:NADP-dependent 3-hydroxy acid dehydrogenase YdfG
MDSKKNTTPAAVVTGAGSGVGRATALKFASEGWNVALLGRRPDALAETIALAAPDNRGRFASLPCDLGDADGLGETVEEVLRCFGRIDVLVNAAGNNVPRRALGELAREDYDAIMDANINGVVHLVQAVVPVMRQQGGGLVVNIGSEAGRQASAKAGAAYVVSKFGLTGFTQTINAEERVNGIRACCIFPGDINTPLLEKRPSPPSADARTRMMQPEDVAECVWFVAALPARVTVEEMLIRPTRA